MASSDRALRHLLCDRDGALPTSATETAWERTPWHAAQSGAWEG